MSRQEDAIRISWRRRITFLREGKRLFPVSGGEDFEVDSEIRADADLRANPPDRRINWAYVPVGRRAGKVPGYQWEDK